MGCPISKINFYKHPSSLPAYRQHLSINHQPTNKDLGNKS